MKKIVAALIATAFASGVAFTTASAQAKTEPAVQKPVAGAKQALKKPVNKAAAHKHKHKAAAKSKKTAKLPKPA